VKKRRGGEKEGKPKKGKKGAFASLLFAHLIFSAERGKGRGEMSRSSETGGKEGKRESRFSAGTTSTYMIYVAPNVG